MFPVPVDESNYINDVARTTLFLTACGNSLNVSDEIPYNKITTKEDICDALWRFKLPLQRLVTVTTDGALAMPNKEK